MRKIITLLFSITFISTALFSQDNNPLVNSGEVIREGVELHDKENYKEAIEKFKLVPASDTNYYTALYELCNSYNYNKEYKKAIEAAELGLSLKTELEPSFYTSLANAYDDSGDSLKALDIYLSAIKKYPLNYLLHFNAGLTYEKLKNYDAAIEYYQKTLKINLFHPTSHMRLGYLMAEQGHTTASLLSLSMFILIEGQTSRSYNTLLMIEKIAQGNYEPSNKISYEYTGESFKELDLIINSKIALSNKYKSKIKFNTSVAKQLQILFEKFEYNAADNDFWMQTYGKIAQSVYKDNQLEPYLYNILATSGLDDVTKWLKNNKSKTSTFITWADKILDEQRAYKEETVNGEVKIINYLYYKNGAIYGYGQSDSKKEDSKSIGLWVFYYPNGTKKSEILFNKSGLKDGKSVWYHANGQISHVGEYKNDLNEGIYQQFNENGILKQTDNYVNDKLEGKSVLYFETGQKKEEQNYVANKKEGQDIEYFKNGKINFKCTFVNGLMEGDAAMYYENGKPEWKSGTKANGYHGNFEAYYSTGELKSKGTYQDGNPIGLWQFYYKNGKVSETKNFNAKGEVTGENKIYHENGVLETESTFIDGKLTGTTKNYTEDNKLYLIENYDNGICKSVKYTDKNGKTTELKVGNGKVKVQIPNYSGDIVSEGLLDKNKKMGEWKFYNKYGKVTSIENYDKEVLTGAYKSFYENGKVYVECTYKNGERDGYYKKYHKNGKIELEGWYQNGKRQGTWLEYHPTGLIKEKTYLLFDNVTGYQEYYTITGKLETVIKTNGEILESITSYDVNGKVLSKDVFDKGTGTIKYFYPNGKVRKQGTYKSSMLEGDFVWYHSNGKVDMKCNYVCDLRDGKVISYHDNGNKFHEGQYTDNLKTGQWNYYSEITPNRLIKQFYYNAAGDLDSNGNFYHENGKIALINPYKNDSKNGIAKYYNETGELRYEKIFKDNDFIQYAYYKSNNERVVKDIQKGNVDVVSYYSNGKIAAEDKLTDGVLNGPKKYYHSNGQLETSIFFDFDIQEGEELNYYSNGKLKSSESYFYDEKNGTFKFYRIDGTLEREETYLLGLKHGPFKNYDASGKLINTVTYEFDEIASSN